MGEYHFDNPEVSIGGKVIPLGHFKSVTILGTWDGPQGKVTFYSGPLPPLDDYASRLTEQFGEHPPRIFHEGP